MLLYGTFPKKYLSGQAVLRVELLGLHTDYISSLSFNVSLRRSCSVTQVRLKFVILLPQPSTVLGLRNIINIIDHLINFIPKISENVLLLANNICCFRLNLWIGSFVIVSHYWR